MSSKLSKEPSQVVGLSIFFSLWTNSPKPCAFFFPFKWTDNPYPASTEGGSEMSFIVRDTSDEI